MLKPEKAHQFVVDHKIDRRIVGDSPAIGRVSRISRSGPKLLKRRRRKRSHEDFGPKRRRKRSLKVITWSITFTIATAAVILGVVWFRVENQRPEIIAQKPPIQANVPVRFPSPSHDEALALVKQAVQAQNPGAIETSFHLGSTAPEEALETLQSLNQSVGSVSHLRWLGSMDLNGDLLDSVLIHYQSHDRKTTRLASLKPNETGVWKVDFHSFARTNIPAWNEIIKENCKGGQVRVLLSKDNYYNLHFSDEGVWSCYSLKSEDSDVTLLGYCRVGSAQDAAMKHILRRATDKGVVAYRPHAILELRRVENAENRQIEITRVLAEGWVMSDIAFDKISQDLQH